MNARATQVPRTVLPRFRASGLLGFLTPGVLLLGLLVPRTAPAACGDPEPALQNFTGGGQVVCPCFIAGEEAGSVFDAPAGDYPIEILRVGIGWGSSFGGSPQVLEQAIHVYGAGLPNPGARLYSLPGPVLTDGFINEFDVSVLGWDLASGPFSVTLEFMNDNSGDPFAGSVVHDGNGCQAGKNLVKAIPGGWADACALGVTGDWVFTVVYKQNDCSVTGAEDTHFAMSTPAFLMVPAPNPFRSRTRIGFLLDEPGDARVAVFDIAGRQVALLADGAYPEGRTDLSWDGRADDGSRAPAGVYFVKLDAAGTVSTRKVFVEN